MTLFYFKVTEILHSVRYKVVSSYMKYYILVLNSDSYK